MRRLLAILAIFILAPGIAWGATRYARATGNWWNAATWSDVSCADSGPGTVPLADDAVVICSTFTVTWDTASGVRIPATSGSLASLTGEAAGTGYIAVALTAGETYSLNVTGDITATGKGGANGGIIQVSGTAPASTATLNITCANLIGGTASTAYGLYNAATTANAVINIIGHVIGGNTVSSVSNAGVYNSGTGTITISNGVEGGTTYNGCPGVKNNSTGVISITGNLTANKGPAYSGDLGGATLSASTNLIDSADYVAYTGKPPTWAPNATTYIQWRVTGTTDKKWYWDIPASSNVLPSDTVAGVTGTAASGGGAWAN